MSEEHQEEIVRHVRVSSFTLFFLCKVHREGLLENIRSTGQHYLMAVNGFTFYYQSDVTELSHVE